MTRLRYTRPGGGRPRGLLAQLAGMVLGLAVLFVSLVLGAFLLAGLLGFMLLAGAAVVIRAWWLGRRMARDGAANPPGSDDVIEAEYRVVHTETVERRRRE
jgi:hypothetical protein